MTGDAIEALVELLATITKSIVRLAGQKMTDEEADAHARATLKAPPRKQPLPNRAEVNDLADDGELNGSTE